MGKQILLPQENVQSNDIEFNKFLNSEFQPSIKKFMDKLEFNKTQAQISLEQVNNLQV